MIHTLPVSSQASAVARIMVRQDLPPTTDRGTLADAQLVASELVENVVRHSSLGSDDEFSSEILSGPDVIRIVVEDGGSGFSRDELLPPSLDPWSGNGLRIVDAIASRWDAERSPMGGTIAWEEVDT